MEAKLRLLLVKMESIPEMALVHPYVHSFTKEAACFTRQDMEAALCGQSVSTNGVSTGSVWTRTFYFGLYIRTAPGKWRRIIESKWIHHFPLFSFHTTAWHERSNLQLKKKERKEINDVYFYFFSCRKWFCGTGGDYPVIKTPSLFLF